MPGQFITIVLIAIVLGADAFSLSLGMGIKGVSPKYEKRFSALVAIFHVLMPLLGLTLGMAAGNYLGIWAGRIGAVILIYIGLEMLWKTWQDIRPHRVTFTEAGEYLDSKKTGLKEGWPDIILLTISVSIDALTVGFSLGTVKAPLLLTVFIMGIVAGSMTMLGFKSGRFFSRMVGTYSQAVGGLVLLILAVKMAFGS